MAVSIEHNLHPSVNYSTIYVTVLYFVVLTLGLLTLVASEVQLSPIDIDTGNTIKASGPFQFNDQYEADMRVDGNLVNTGAIIKFVPNSKVPAAITNQLGAEYILQEIIYHWGETSSEGSEHQVDGDQFAAEIQFVHRNLGVSPTYSIVSVLCRAVSTSSSGVWSQLSPIPAEGKVVPVSGISYADLLPATQGYYQYKGSHTIPSYPMTDWYVMKDTIDIPEDFLESLRKVQPSNHATPTKYDPPIFEYMALQ